MTATLAHWVNLWAPWLLVLWVMQRARWMTPGTALLDKAALALLGAGAIGAGLSELAQIFPDDYASAALLAGVLAWCAAPTLRRMPLVQDLTRRLRLWRAR